jgi:hypothetical protein
MCQERIIGFLRGSKKLVSLNLFLSVLILISVQSFGFVLPEDTIIVKVGERKKIIFWGETKEDLKDLEKYDLNLIIRQMNQDLDEMPSDLKRMYRRDYDGNTFSKKDAEDTEYLTRWQKLKRNTYLNISFGMTSSKILLRNIKKNASQPFGLPQELYEQKIWTSPNINLSLIRHEVFLRSGRKEILLRYGFDLSWHYLNHKSTKQTGYEINYGLNNDTTYIYKPSNGNYYLVEPYSSESKKTVVWKSIPKESLLYTNFKIIPTISLYDKSNRRVFNLGFGAYIGTLLSGSQIIKKEDSFDKRGLKIPLKGEENPVRYGLVLNVGYRAINLFLESDINNLFRDRNEKNTWSQNLTTFGIRLGK